MADEEADPFAEGPDEAPEPKKPSMVGYLVFVVIAAFGIGVCAAQSSEDQTPCEKQASELARKYPQPYGELLEVCRQLSPDE